MVDLKLKHIIVKQFGTNYRVYTPASRTLGEIYKENGVYKFWQNGAMQGYTVSVMSEIIDVVAKISLSREEDSA